MTQDDWKTLRVPPEAYDTAKAQKEQAGRTWGEQLVAPVEPDYDRENLAERLDAVMNKLEQLEGAQADTVGDALELADISNHDVLEQLDTVERAAKEATSAAQR